MQGMSVWRGHRLLTCLGWGSQDSGASVNHFLFYHPTEVTTEEYYRNEVPSMKVRPCGSEVKEVQLPLSGQQDWGNGNFREVHKQISLPNLPQTIALCVRVHMQLTIFAWKQLHA